MPASRNRRAKTDAAVSIFCHILSLSDNFKQTERRGSDSTGSGSNDALLTQNYNFLRGTRLSLGEADSRQGYISGHKSPRTSDNRISELGELIMAFSVYSNYE